MYKTFITNNFNNMPCPLQFAECREMFTVGNWKIGIQAGAAEIKIMKSGIWRPAFKTWRSSVWDLFINLCLWLEECLWSAAGKQSPRQNMFIIDHDTPSLLRFCFFFLNTVHHNKIQIFEYNTCDSFD